MRGKSVKGKGGGGRSRGGGSTEKRSDVACDQKHVTKSGKRGEDWLQLVVKWEEDAWAGRRGAMAWPMALLGNTMAHGGQASVEAHKGGSTGNSLTKNGASGWLCRRPALPSAVGSIAAAAAAWCDWRPGDSPGGTAVVGMPAKAPRVPMRRGRGCCN